MKWYKFDKKVKQEMAAHQSEVDLDALWGSIEADVDAINEQKKRRRLVFWWFFFGVLVLGSGLGYYFLQANSPESGTVISSEKIEEQQKEVRRKEAKETATLEAENSLENNLKNATPTVLNDEKTTAETVKSNSTKKAIAKTRDNTPSSQNNLTRTLKLAKTDAEKAKNVAAISLEKQMAANDFPEIEAQKINKTQSNLPILQTENKRATIVESKDKNDLFQLKYTTLSTLDFPKKELHRDVLSEVEKQTFRRDFLKEKKEQDEQKNRNFHLSMSLLGSVSFTDRQLNADTASTAISELLQRRNLTERILETTQLGLQMHWQHKSGFELSSGINFTQINEKFEYNQADIQVDSIMGIDFYYVNVNGDTTAHQGMIPQTTTTTYRQRHFNKIRIFEVPILLGYRQQIRKFSVGAQAGVFVNVNTNSSIKNFKLADNELQLNQERVLNLDFRLSYHFGAIADFRLNDNWSIYVSPFMRYYPKNFRETQSGLTQKYALYGGTVGIRYSIF